MPWLRAGAGEKKESTATGDVNETTLNPGSKWKRAVIVGLPARRQACTPDHVDISGVVFKGQGICLHALSLRAEDL